MLAECECETGFFFILWRPNDKEIRKASMSEEKQKMIAGELYLAGDAT